MCTVLVIMLLYIGALVVPAKLWQYLLSKRTWAEAVVPTCRCSDIPIPLLSHTLMFWNLNWPLNSDSSTFENLWKFKIPSFFILFNFTALYYLPHGINTTSLIHLLHSFLSIFSNCSFKIHFSGNLYFSGTCCLNLVCQLIFRGHHTSNLIFLQVQKSHSEQNWWKVLPRNYAWEYWLKCLPSLPSQACSITYLSGSEPGLLPVSAKPLAHSPYIHS